MRLSHACHRPSMSDSSLQHRSGVRKLGPLLTRVFTPAASRPDRKETKPLPVTSLRRRLNRTPPLETVAMPRSTGPYSGSSTKIALASAGVALGAGAFFFALRIQRSSSSSSDLPKAIPIANAVNELNDLPPNTDLETKSSEQGPQAEESSVGKKEPCEGCDCGMMEPGPIEGTMHSYERHVIICSGQEDWPKVIEAEESSLAESIFNMCLGAGLIWTKKVAKEAEANKQAAPKNRVKVTACSEPSRGPPGTTDVIVYPEGLLYSLDPEDFTSLERFVKAQLVEGKPAPDLEPKPVSYQKMVLVCTHMSRDKRCGRAGPQVLEEMGKELEARGVTGDQIALRGSSHFGGHKYAGVLIIYPQGDWYGLVNKKNAAAIINKCVLGTEGMKENWRGNMSNPGVKAEPAKAVTPKAITPEALVSEKLVSESSVATRKPEKVRHDSVDGA